MKKFTIVLAVLMCAISLHAQTRVSGTIDSQIWTRANSPYLVVGDIKVVNLEIQPGVRVLFNGNYLFEVTGVLKAVGTAQDSIVFTKTDSVTGWRGIFFNFSSPGPDLAYCRVSFSKNSGINFERTLRTLRNCTISNNSGTGNGGGIFVNNGSFVFLTNCTLTKNSASIGGGVYLGSNSFVALTNCVLADNSASAFFNAGGGIYTEGREVNLTNCTIAFNNNTGMRVQGGTAKVINSIFYFNASVQISTPSLQIISVTHSNIEGGFPGVGNINVPPIFADGRKLTLANFSPCVDAGDPDSSFFDICFPPSLKTQRNDMGAYGGPGACCWLASLTAPSLVSPSDGIVGQSKKLTLKWRAVSGAASYQVQVAKNVNFSPTERDISGIKDTSVVVSGLDSLATYYWQVKATNSCGTTSNWSNIRRFTVPVNERTGTTMPTEFSLTQNYPNPFNPATTIRYALPKAVHVKLTIFDPLGKEIETIVSKTQAAGEYEIQWNPSHLTSGVYLYRLQAGEFVETRKMVLMR
jgi:hypothetical protein